MLILGISAFYHDSAAVLMLDGEILVRPSWSERAELTIMLLFGLVLLLLVPRLKTHYTVLLYVIMTVLLVIATSSMYVQKNLLLNPAPTVIFTFLLFAHLIYNKFNYYNLLIQNEDK